MIRNLFDLTGRKAIVTGGGKGIGLGITKGLATAGAEVVIVGSSPETESIAEAIYRKGYRVQGLQGDLSDTRQIPVLFNKAVQLLGDLDILVNNAGIQSRQAAKDFQMEDWQRILDINLTASFLLCQCAAKIMIPKKYGKIINMASMTSFFGSVHIAAYAASKGGIAQMTKALSNEWAVYGINVNAIAPGGFKTEMTKALWSDPEADRCAMERTPAARWGNQEDIMGTAVYLASKASDYVCGVILPVDGGYLVR